MDYFYRLIKLFPPRLRGVLQEHYNAGQAVEEIRVRIGYGLVIRSAGNEISYGQANVTAAEMRYLIDNATECSFHSSLSYLQQGYIPLVGGSRMGVCGSGENGMLRDLDEIRSVCLRVARGHVGCADEIYGQVYDDRFYSTIIIAPPAAGKTTLLRDLIRRLSLDGLYVGVADERGEISGNGSFDLGPRCDTLVGINKRQAAMMLLRSMSPQVLAMDEITAHGDGDAIMEAVGCGVGLLTTVHGDDLHVLKKRGFSCLQEMTAFERAVMVRVVDGRREYEVIKLYE